VPSRETKMDSEGRTRENCPTTRASAARRCEESGRRTTKFELASRGHFGDVRGGATPPP
jgi:hypothetical protein